MFPFDWKTLKIAAGSRIAKFSVLAPIFGWLIVKNNELGKLLAVVFNMQSLALPLESLNLFYCGLFLFGLGALLFSFFCPSEIQLYASKDDYRIRRLPTLTANDANSIAARIAVDLHVIVTNLDGGVSSHDQFIRDNQTALLDLLAQHYRQMNTSNRVTRTAVSAMVIIGGLLTFVPSFQTFCGIVYDRLL